MALGLRASSSSFLRKTKDRLMPNKKTKARRTKKKSKLTTKAPAPPVVQARAVKTPKAVPKKQNDSASLDAHLKTLVIRLGLDRSEQIFSEVKSALNVGVLAQKPRVAPVSLDGGLSHGMKSRFVRERPDMTVAELIAEAEAVGMPLKKGHVYNIRSNDKKIAEG